tara:strand:+ start:6145 stop:6417 length:273 start_codon:yes stop_codon:yes gene_type:complete
MMILDLKPVADTGAGLRVIAQFDLQLSDDVRLYGVRLLEAPDGGRIVYAAQAGSRRTATFSRALAEEITEAASKAYRGATTANDNFSKAA